MSLIHERNPRLDSHQDEVSSIKEREAVEVAAEAQLRQSSYPQLYEVRCEFHYGVLTLRGRVSSYYLKQLAQNFVHRLGKELDVEIDNRLDVVSPPVSGRLKPQ